MSDTLKPDIDWQVKVLSRVGSTQDIVMLAAQDGDPEGYTVQAMTQVSARGRHGNEWEAPMGNIYLSTLLRPECDMVRVGELAFMVAVALYRTLVQYIDTDKHDVTLKWPNDILVDGRKISGILLESNIEEGALNGVVVGIGVNILVAPEKAVFLQDVSGTPVFVNKVRDVMLLELDKAYAQWKQEGFVPIREAWLMRAHGIGGKITARLPDISYEGIFSGLTDDGGLILQMGNGEEKIITAGEVHFGESE